jgi:hypothetical protein
MKAIVLSATTSVFLGLSSAALPATIDYVMTCGGPAAVCANWNDNGAISFSMPQFPTPDLVDSSRAVFYNVPITVNGVSSTFADFALLTFPIYTHQGFSYSLPNAPHVPFAFSGTAIFQGSLGAPQLVPGDFTESGHVNGQAASFELLATLGLGSPTPVPEPTTWTAMICGLCALGVVRWRRSVVFMRRGRHGRDKPGHDARQQITI